MAPLRTSGDKSELRDALRRLDALASEEDRRSTWLDGGRGCRRGPAAVAAAPAAAAPSAAGGGAGAGGGAAGAVARLAAAERSIWRAKAVHEAQLRESGVAEPWKLVEGLSDALLEEVLQSAAQEMFESADAVVEAIVGAEFGDAPKAVAV